MELREKFEKMKVAELRAESKERGLTLEKDGVKFKKAELIERLISFEEEKQNIEIEKEESVVENKTQERKSGCSEDVRYENGRIILSYTVPTLDEIIKKYGDVKSVDVYNRQLVVEGFVVFVDYVEPEPSRVYRKLRTAKVKRINRKKELVVVETLAGTEKTLAFSEILYMKARKEQWYPFDIRMFLKYQRTKSGNRFVKERLSQENVDER